MIDRYDVTEMMGIIGLLFFVAGTLAVIQGNFTQGVNMLLLLSFPTGGLVLMVLAGLIENASKTKPQKAVS